MGGAETFLMKLYRNLDRSRFQMDFCINRESKQFYEDEINALGGKIHRIPCKSDSVTGFRRGLFNTIKSSRYEYVLRVASNAMGFLDLKIAHDAGARVCAARTSSAGGDLSLKAKCAHIIGQMLYGRYVNVKIAPSDLAAIHTFGKRAYETNEVVMLRNALNLDEFKFKGESRCAVRLKYGIPEMAKVVGHVGQLRIEKNHKFLLRVFAELSKGSGDTYLLLVGAGDQAEALKKQVSSLGITERVVFAGAQQDVPAYLSAMDVFVMPSFYEGMPNAVIEAQATGLPCVVADTITREANITGLVEYVSLRQSVEHWADIVSRLFAAKRRDTRADFVANGYEIKAVTREFERIIFGAQACR